MRSRYQFDTGVDTGRKDTALMRAEPRWPGRLRLRLLAAVLIAAFAALTIYAYTANVSVVSAASPCPAVNDWCTTMTVADAEGDGLLHGYEFDKFGSIVDDTIQPGGENINVWTVHTFAHPLPQLTDYIYFGSIPRVPRGTQVTIEGHTFIADAESDDGELGDRWDFPSGELPASLVWSAGQEVTVSVKLASPCDNLDNLVNAIVVKNLTGEITQAGDTNLHKIRLDPYKSYLIEAIGVDGRDMLGVEEHPNLTLEDPEIPAIWNARGKSKWITYGSKSDGKNAIRRILRTDYLTYKIEVSSGNNGTGTYQLKVRVNNICRINDDGDVQYQWAGGPEGYPAHSDLPAGTGGRQVLLARIHRCGAALGLEQGVRAVGRDGPRSIPINGAGGGLWLSLGAPMAVLGSGAGAGSAGQHAGEDNRGPGRCDSVGRLGSLVDVSGAVGAVRQAMAGLAIEPGRE